MDEETQTPETETGSTGYSAFVPEIWSQKLNTMLDKDCVMLQCVNRNWEGEIKNQGGCYDSNLIAHS